MSVHADFQRVDPAVFHGKTKLTRYFSSISEARSHAVAASRSKGRERGRIVYHNGQEEIGEVSLSKKLTWRIREY